jgi:hypothetical protein
MQRWWNELQPGEQATLVGGLAVGVGLVSAAVVVGRMLQSGVDVNLELEPATRNLVSSGITDLTESVDRVVDKGVPIGVRLGPAVAARLKKKIA